jgi:hypothetical protein
MLKHSERTIEYDGDAVEAVQPVPLLDRAREVDKHEPLNRLNSFPIIFSAGTRCSENLVNSKNIGGVQGVAFAIAGPAPAWHVTAR